MSNNKDNYPDHLHEDYNRRDNMTLGMPKKDYIYYCKKIAREYDQNEHLTLNSICNREQRKGILLYPSKLRRILEKFNIPVRPAGYRPPEKRILMRFTINEDDKFFIDNIKETAGRTMRRDYVAFCIDIVRGNPTRSGILYLDRSQLKPVVFLWNSKNQMYLVLTENLSTVEEQKIRELVSAVEETKNLDPVRSYAEFTGLTFIGDNYEE